MNRFSMVPENVLRSIRKDFDEKPVLRHVDATNKSDPAMSTGGLTLDLALGVGGWLLREKIGVIFGSLETTLGGKDLKFHDSCRLQIQCVGAIKDKEGQDVGKSTRVKSMKNKVVAPFPMAEFDILCECGISCKGSIHDAALDRSIVEKRGSWFAYGDVQMAWGQLAVFVFLRETPKSAEAISEVVKDVPLKAA